MSIVEAREHRGSDSGGGAGIQPTSRRSRRSCLRMSVVTAVTAQTRSVSRACSICRPSSWRGRSTRALGLRRRRDQDRYAIDGAAHRGRRRAVCRPSSRPGRARPVMSPSKGDPCWSRRRAPPDEGDAAAGRSRHAEPAGGGGARQHDGGDERAMVERRRIPRLGPRAVLVKGATSRLRDGRPLDGRDLTPLSRGQARPPIPRPGCTYSSAIAARLARAARCAMRSSRARRS